MYNSSRKKGKGIMIEFKYNHVDQENWSLTWEGGPIFHVHQEDDIEEDNIKTFTSVVCAANGSGHRLDVTPYRPDQETISRCCYYYIKAGKWPTRLMAGTGGPIERNDSDKLINT